MRIDRSIDRTIDGDGDAPSRITGRFGRGIDRPCGGDSWPGRDWWISYVIHTARRASGACASGVRDADLTPRDDDDDDDDDDGDDDGGEDDDDGGSGRARSSRRCGARGARARG